MDVSQQRNHEQEALWNGRAGRSWVESQDLLEQMYRPFEDRLVEAVSAAGGRSILDVGCGAGSTTLAVARLLGADGRCVGVDIAEPMIAAARARAERERSSVRFLHANAQEHTFEPAQFDLIISRFGVMFFDDPVAAFANLRRAAQDSAGLALIVWRGVEDNPFMTTAERAAAPLLSNLPARRPDAPGQFGFANPDRVRGILDASGWRAIEMTPIDVVCTLPERELVNYFTRFGPVGLVLHEADDRTRSQVIETVRAAFEPYVHGDDVRYTAACWMIRASAASH
jgi:SAM-dependent methyltransferase